MNWFDYPIAFLKGPAQRRIAEHLPPVARHRARGARDRALSVPMRAAFRSNLRLLNAVLDRAGLAERVWVSGGLLLGWARTGRPLPNDYTDADFGFLEADHAAVIAGFDALVSAGFAPGDRWRRNDGSISEWVFTRGGARFEFFEHRPRGDSLEVTGYFPERSSWADFDHASGEPIMQSHLLLPRQPLVPFQLVGRTWLKHADHEAELEALYGPRWRWPARAFYAVDWSTGRDSPAVSERVVWERRSISWDGSLHLSAH